ncbi:glycosyltransferase family A protein [Olivibacter ginsenosidimutans]|uniref:Glycosyltransferase family A protein n=1 Tax=Olivibacter ginsenosidimutans TaxID=1176537 RepID=A0ABP9AFD7_9SPHI
MRPFFLPSYVREQLRANHWFIDRITEMNARISALNWGEPEVSIVIPAYNEEARILKTLSSLSYIISKYAIEIIVVDNNSNDNTKQLVEMAGAVYVFEGMQGVKYARNRGLLIAKGKYILNADADSIYSPYWVDVMVNELMDKNVGCIYGKFAFFPERNHSRLAYYLYECFADGYKWIKGTLRDKAMFVYGFNSGFRRTDGLAVGGFEHPEGSNEDGYLALKLRDQRFGALKLVKAKDAVVFTSSRRIDELGGPFRAFFKQITNKTLFR